MDYCQTARTTIEKVTGQDGITIRSYDMGDTPGWVTIKYDTYTVKDRIDIKYAGEWVLSTGQLLSKNQTPPIGQCSNVTLAQGFVGQSGEFNILYDPKKGKRIDIYISGCLDGGTQWVFEILGCPEEKAYLGIHSSEPANGCKNDCKNWGHAWVSLTENGKTTYFGLWPDGHDEVRKRGLANGNGSDIRIGIESGFGEHVRFYLINQVQKARFQDFLRHNITYSVRSYNCASFASNLVFETVGERVSATGPIEYGFIPMPCALSESIRHLNTTRPSNANYSPIGIKYTGYSRSFCE